MIVVIIPLNYTSNPDLYRYYWLYDSDPQKTSSTWSAFNVFDTPRFVKELV